MPVYNPVVTIAPIETINTPAAPGRRSVAGINYWRSPMAINELLRSLLAAYASGAAGRSPE